jgi:hypothetical protein
MRIEVDHHRRTNRETLAEALRIEEQIGFGIIGKAAWEVTRREIIHPEVEGLENFATFRKHLIDGGTGIIYLKDPLSKIAIPLAAGVVEKHVTSLDHVGVFVSRRQVDWHQGAHLPNLAQHLLLESIWGTYPGIKMFRVVQEKDRETYPDWAEYNDNSYEQAGDFAEIAGDVMVVTPEGERTPNGLGEAKIGFAAHYLGKPEKPPWQCQLPYLKELPG